MLVATTCMDNALWSDGSVIHDCTDMAVRMGVKEITYVGLDLCHAYDKSHVDGVSGSTYNVKSMTFANVIDGHGNVAHATSALRQIRSSLEGYIARTNGVAFYKRGRAGVPIKGVTWID